MLITGVSFSLAAMNFNESVRTCPKKFFQVVEKHIREGSERGSQGFSRKRDSVSMVNFIRQGADAQELEFRVFQVRAAPW